MGESKQFLFQFRIIRLRSEMGYLVSDTTDFYKEATDEVPVLLSVFEVLLKPRPVLGYDRRIMPKAAVGDSSWCPEVFINKK